MNGAGVLCLDLTSDPQELPGARDTIRHWTQTAGWPAEAVADIVLAVDEALCNVIRHGYNSEPGHKIELRARTGDDPQKGPFVEVCIRDYGRQVPIEKICGRDLDDIRPGGLGVHIIKSVMCFTEYAHAEGGGMHLTMRKYRQSVSEGGDAPCSQS